MKGIMEYLEEKGAIPKAEVHDSETEDDAFEFDLGDEMPEPEPVTDENSELDFLKAIRTRRF